MTTLYAQPYSIDYVGFYFDSLEDFNSRMAQLASNGCEEVEIQFIEGDLGQADFFERAGICQSQIKLWFEELEDLDHQALIALSFLLSCGYNITGALERYQEVSVQTISAVDYAYDLIDETVTVPESLRHYIDYEAIARDMLINNEIVEWSSAYLITNPLEF